MENDDLREQAANELERIFFQGKVAGLENRVSFLEEKLAIAVAARLEAENETTSWDQAKKITQLEDTISNLRNQLLLAEANGKSLREKLFEVEKILQEVLQIVTQSVDETLPGCAEKKFHDIARLIEGGEPGEETIELFVGKFPAKNVEVLNAMIGDK